MIAFGICLLIIAAIVPNLATLWSIGIVVLVIGLILLTLGRMGRAVGGSTPLLLKRPLHPHLVIRLPR